MCLAPLAYNRLPWYDWFDERVSLTWSILCFIFLWKKSITANRKESIWTICWMRDGLLQNSPVALLGAIIHLYWCLQSSKLIAIYQGKYNFFVVYWLKRGMLVVCVCVCEFVKIKRWAFNLVHTSSILKATDCKLNWVCHTQSSILMRHFNI